MRIDIVPFRQRFPKRPARLALTPLSRQESGQSLIEFSIMMVFMVVLLMGVLDLARAYFTYLALKDAAAEGAYFGSAFPQCVDDNGIAMDPDGIENDGAACAEPNNVLYRVEHSAVQGGLVDWSGATITTTLPTTLTAGTTLTVSVEYTYQLLTPFVGAIVNGQQLTLTAKSAATIIRVPNCTQPTGCQ
jgi:Flp pilus assembly protein TadG